MADTSQKPSSLHRTVAERYIKALAERQGACAHCGETRPFDAGWGYLFSNDGQSWAFCHGGCLAFWIADQEPGYFQELDLEPKP